MYHQSILQRSIRTYPRHRVIPRAKVRLLLLALNVLMRLHVRARLLLVSELLVLVCGGLALLLLVPDLLCVRWWMLPLLLPDRLLLLRLPSQMLPLPNAHVHINVQLAPRVVLRVLLWLLLMLVHGCM